MEKPEEKVSGGATKEEETGTQNEPSKEAPKCEEAPASNDEPVPPKPAITGTELDQLYSGAWTGEEKRYATALIEEFRDGNIPDLPEKTTMRGYLAEKLMCPTKRISKKYEGSGYNGRLPYTKGALELDPDEALKRQEKLIELEEDFKKSRIAIIAAKEAAPPRKSPKSPTSKPKKKKPTLLTAAHTNQLRRGSPTPLGGQAGLPGAASLHHLQRMPMGLGVGASQDLMLQAMIQERSRIAALGAAGVPPPTHTDMLLARRAALLDPIYGSPAGFLGASGLPLHSSMSGAGTFGSLFPPRGMLRPGMGLGGFAGSDLLQSRAALNASVLHGSLAPASFQQDGLVEILRRKRELESMGAAAAANAGSPSNSSEDPPEAKKARTT
ncbi:expressed unknown protein [Seminavis robusta]|uniref:Uncharacterized protein n=1 Tax=Seminavis robusta TaxID=568900 RepID=A0A9N8HLV0_9STRA|nr:expressed unknown protein [Seminavis robusta]|eukprot:Sro946_g223240.1 n/a (383) ;mRNA; f:14405-15689